MIRVAVPDLRPRMELARPVPHPEAPEQNLLEQGFVLSNREIKGLQRFGVRDCWIRNDRLDFLREALPQDLMEGQRAAMIAVGKTFQTLAAGEVQTLPLRAVEAAVHHLIQTMRSHPLSFVYMEDLCTAGNELAAHAAGVCYLSLTLGLHLDAYIVKQRRNLNYNHARETANLGLGALLHDVGYLALSSRLQTRSAEQLDADEIEAYRHHPQAGFEQLRGIVEPSAANIILNHHQRWDGNGFPARAPSPEDDPAPLSGTGIPVFSRLVAVTNHYQAATQQAVTETQKRTPVQALFEMRFAIYRGWFDPDVESIFYAVTPAFPVGSRVRLSNGNTAAVVDYNPKAPCQPTVLPLSDATGAPLAADDEKELDLTQCTDIYIQEFEGQNISSYLF